MNIEVMRSTLHKSEAGQITFPEVVQALGGVGVESYFADLARRADTFYLPNGETHVEPMTHPAIPVAEEFSKLGIVSAIRAARSRFRRVADHGARDGAEPDRLLR